MFLTNKQIKEIKHLLILQAETTAILLEQGYKYKNAKDNITNKLIDKEIKSILKNTQQ